jgi:hypothetical protein
MRGARPSASCAEAQVSNHANPSDAGPSWLELESVKPLDVAEKVTDLSRDTIKRRYPEFVVKLSPRREGMKLKHILQIAGGK